ncbi:MAG: RING finger protein [Planctomycetota bacterium]|nr:RING finger protein [Planctomycetota bacterium]
MEELDINVSVSSSEQDCPFCQSQFSASESVVHCRSCNAKHHSECWNEHGKCSSCGELENVAEIVEAPRIQVNEKSSDGELDISVTAAPSRPICPFCHAQFSGEENVVDCQNCDAKHHAGCWDTHGKCSSCGDSEELFELVDDRGPRRRRTRSLFSDLDRNVEPVLDSMGSAFSTLLGGRPKSRSDSGAATRSRSQRDARKAPIRSKKRSKDGDSMLFGFALITIFFLAIPILFFAFFGFMAVF